MQIIRTLQEHEKGWRRKRHHSKQRDGKHHHPNGGGKKAPRQHQPKRRGARRHHPQEEQGKHHHPEGKNRETPQTSIVWWCFSLSSTLNKEAFVSYLYIVIRRMLPSSSFCVVQSFPTPLGGGAALLSFWSVLNSSTFRAAVHLHLQRETWLSYRHNTIQFNDLIHLSNTHSTTPKERGKAAPRKLRRAHSTTKRPPKKVEGGKHHYSNGGRRKAPPPQTRRTKRHHPKEEAPAQRENGKRTTTHLWAGAALSHPPLGRRCFFSSFFDMVQYALLG